MHSIRFIIPSLIFLLCQVIILKLAFWQVDRLNWKRDILQALDVVYAEDARSNRLTAEDWRDLDGEEIFFRRGLLKGAYVSQDVLFLGPRQRDGMNGYHVLAVFQLDGGARILVNRGWVPDGLATDDYVSTSFAKGDVELLGFIRKPERSHFFSPSNVPSQALWFGYDIRQFSKAFGEDVLPDVVFYVEEDVSMDTEYPAVFAERWYPRNEHFQYMIFWFSMSAVFLLIYVLAVLLPFLRKKAV